MKYQNKLNQEINFSIAGIKYKVSAMDSVEIPDKFDYVIDSRKLPLKVYKEESKLFSENSTKELEILKEELIQDTKLEKPKNKPGPKPKKDK